MADDPERPWSSFPPDLWEKLLAVAYNDTLFAAADIAAAAELDERQTEAFAAWCDKVEHEDDVRRATDRMSARDRRLIESMGLEPAPPRKPRP